MIHGHDFKQDNDFSSVNRKKSTKPTSNFQICYGCNFQVNCLGINSFFFYNWCRFDSELLLWIRMYQAILLLFCSHRTLSQATCSADIFSFADLISIKSIGTHIFDWLPILCFKVTRKEIVSYGFFFMWLLGPSIQGNVENVKKTEPQFRKWAILSISAPSLVFTSAMFKI